MSAFRHERVACARKCVCVCACVSWASRNVTDIYGGLMRDWNKAKEGQRDARRGRMRRRNAVDSEVALIVA